jgi:hypothetical protein
MHLVLLSLWGFLRVSASLLYSIYGLLYPSSDYNLCMGAQIRSETNDAGKWCQKICVTSRKRMLTVNLSKATWLRRNINRDRLWSGIQERKFFDSHRWAEIFFQRYSFKTRFGPHTASPRIDTGCWNMKVNLPLLPNADANSTSNHL